MSLIDEDISDVLDFAQLERDLCEFLDVSTVTSNIKNQLDEFEMIQSIFYNSGELTLSDKTIIKELQDYTVGKGCNTLPRNLDFTVNIAIEGHAFEIVVNLPLEYPILEPDIYVRCSSYDRNQQHLINSDLSTYISSLSREEACIYSCVMWIQENALNYLKKKVESEKKTKKSDAGCSSFARFWIYSHHIYSKTKRKALQDLADEYRLSGFSLPGKPGIICYEGRKDDCDECWNQVRNMNWKKIGCVKMETTPVPVDDPQALEHLRRFVGFEEVAFESGKLRGREYHSDFGEFYKYLSQHNSDYAFKMLFGVDGKMSLNQNP